jgi:hypothetical protein
MRDKIRIKGWQFLEEVAKNPSWALQVPNETTIIVENYIHLENSKIKGIGKNITFAGVNAEDGSCASFKNCPYLEKVEALFLCPVKFQDCGLKTTEGIRLDRKSCSEFRVAASFRNCSKLNIATGHWPGAVDYSGSSITRTENLVIENANNQGEAAFFNNCKDLTELSGQFPGMVSACFCPNLTNTKNLKITNPNTNGVAIMLRACTSLNKAEGDFNGFADYKGSPVSNINPEQLIIRSTNKEGFVASFWGCEFLTEATGDWNGALDLSHSAIKSTKGLRILKPNAKGVAILLCSCPNVEVAEGIYHGMVDYSNSAIKNIGKFKIIPPQNLKIWGNFENCHNLNYLPTNIPIEKLLASKELIEKKRNLLNMGEKLGSLNSKTQNQQMEL